FRPDLSVTSHNPVLTFGRQVVLELKFTNRFPDWFRELVRVFNLMQFSASKYCEGITLLGEHRFHDGDRSAAWLEEPHITSPTEESSHRATHVLASSGSLESTPQPVGAAT